MTVLVTGAGGQLGRELVTAFGDHDVVGLARDQLDVADEAAVFDAVASIRPDLVVNAAAWTDVDACEAEPARAHAVNALGPWWLARACLAAGATLVAVSTDYVFGGAPPLGGHGHGYTEFDPVAPVNAYGRAKAAGEELVRRTLPAHHIVRTSWVGGRGERSFVRAVLDRARAGEEIRAVDDQVGCPTNVSDLAAAIRELAVAGRYGTWHRTNDGHATRYELAVATLRAVGLDVPLRPVSAGQLGQRAPRPSWSVLDATHATASGLQPLPHWRDGLHRLLAQLGEVP